MVIAMIFYFFYRLTQAYEITLAVLFVIVTVGWLISVWIAIEREWTQFWWRFGILGLAQPGFLIFVVYRILR